MHRPPFNTHGRRRLARSRAEYLAQWLRYVAQRGVIVDHRIDLDSLYRCYVKLAHDARLILAGLRDDDRISELEQWKAGDNHE